MPRLTLRYAAVALACAGAAHGQAVVTTAAGGGFINNAPAVQTYLNNPRGVAVDASGNLYIADANRILRVDHATGILSAVAGVPATSGGNSPFVQNPQGDGPALSVSIAATDLAVNAGGNVLFLDGSMLRQLNVQQAVITTIAVMLNEPQQFCLDSAGNIYIVELAGHVRRIDAKTGVIATIAGNGGSLFGGDGGPATEATLVRPAGIAVDSSGNLYIADAGDFRIRKINAATGTIASIAGTGHALEGGDGGSALQASFLTLGELAIDSHNNLSLIDGDRVRRIAAATGTIATVAGNGTQAVLNAPAGLALDSAGNLYIADSGSGRVRMVSAATGTISTVAGTSQNGDGGLADGAVLNKPQGLAVDAAGDLFIAESSLIREVNAATHIISTFAGGGTSTQDGVPALQAKMNPISLHFDSAGNLMVGEPGLIRRIDAGGTVTTIAGTGVVGYSGDGGPATSAQVGYVTALAIDSSGGVLFADFSNKRLRRVDSGTGVITTVAGNGQAAFTGLGQAATATGIGNVLGVAVDSKGNIYIGSNNTYLILKISPAGAVSVAGGIGGCGYIGDGGPATGAFVCQAASFALDASSNIYVGDTICACVRRIAADTGLIQTVVGNGTTGYSGDNGPATQAQLRSISSIALSGTTLYVADGVSAVVRSVTPDTPPALPAKPILAALGNAASFQLGPVAPGELVTLFGHYLGPATPAQWQLGSDGLLTIPNANVQIFFDDVPAPLIYISAGQINAVAPYAVANGLSTVRVQAAGGSVSSTSVGATATAPGIFYYGIVNEDGSLNDPSHPAPVGTYVTMYGTGLGQTTPPGVDNTVTPTVNYPKQISSVTMTIGRNPLFSTPAPMKVLYAGPAPGLAAGVCQIDAVVPAGVEPGLNFVEIQAGAGGIGPPLAFYVQ